MAVTALAISPSGGPEACAQAAGLRYVDDNTVPGIRRLSRGEAFAYEDPAGHRVRDRDTLERIRGLAIPPAWSDVWICPLPDGHLQATGRDARRRKQYRYHDRWREIRDATKYHRMNSFGEVLPLIRAQVARDLARPGLERKRVLAALVRLLDVALIRVGGAEYAKANGSYGLTTMRARHVDVNGSHISFAFRGKSGVHRVVDVRDRRVARILQRCLDLPGQELFQYLDDDDVRHSIGSDDVNGYLREISGSDVTTKDFRTWTGTVMTACALYGYGRPASERDAKRQVIDAIKQVSRELGNTAAVCRRCYVHPQVIDAHADGSLFRLALCPGHRTDRQIAGLRDEERAVLRLLRSGGGGPPPLTSWRRPSPATHASMIRKVDGQRYRGSQSPDGHPH